MARLVDDLLDVSRVAQGKITLLRSCVDWVDAVQAGVELCGPLIDQRNHELALLLPPRGTVWSHGDPTRLAQVVGNRLTNAAKYTDPGGRIEVKLTGASGEATLEVSDNGLGIASDVLLQVFELLVQAERSLDRARGGLGIGLSLVKSLVELHGGRVDAESAGLGSGSRFTVSLPLTHPDAAQSLCLLLELEGRDVRVVHSCEHVVDAAGAFAPDAVLLDIGLPGIDGYEVARRLRAVSQLSACRLIAITGYGQADDHARSEAAGFDHHLVKPVEPDRVLELIGETAPRSANFTQ